VDRRQDLVKVDGFSLENSFPLSRWDVVWSACCDADKELAAFDVSVKEVEGLN